MEGEILLEENYSLLMDLLRGALWATVSSVIIVLFVLMIAKVRLLVYQRYHKFSEQMNVVSECMLEKSKIYMIDIDGNKLVIAEHRYGVSKLAFLASDDNKHTIDDEDDVDELEDRQEKADVVISEAAPIKNLQEAVDVAMKLNGGVQ